MARWSGDVRASAVAAALGPYAWRDLTERMLARRAVGAVDRHQVIGLLSSVPGTDVGVVGAVEPAEACDERVHVLVGALEGQYWRGWSLARLCTEVVSSLTSWQAERDSFESGLRRLLEGH